MTSEHRSLIAPDEGGTLHSSYSHREILIPHLRRRGGESPFKKGRLFFFDETDVYWCPDTGRIYQLPKKQVKIDSPGKNQIRYLLGSVEYPSGEGLYEIYEHKRNEEVK